MTADVTASLIHYLLLACSVLLILLYSSVNHCSNQYIADSQCQNQRTQTLVEQILSLISYINCFELANLCTRVTNNGSSATENVSHLFVILIFDTFCSEQPFIGKEVISRSSVEVCPDKA
ncbi:hypothetical protein ABZP36_021607 [Zizania latifolia]